MSLFTDADLLAAVKKQSTVRLVLELGRAQAVLDEDQIADLTRSELISYVFHLRHLNGQKGTIKDEVPNFDISQVVMLTNISDVEEVSGRILPDIPAPTPSQGGASSADNLILILIQNMAEEKVRLEKREAEEKVRLEKREAEEKIRLEKKEAEEKIRLEKKEDEEKIRLEDKKVRLEKREADERTRVQEEKIRLEKKEEEERIRIEKRDADKLTRLQEERTRQEKKEADERTLARQDKINELARLERKELADRKFETDKLEEENRRKVDEFNANIRFQLDSQTRIRQQVENDKLLTENRRIAENARYEVRLERAHKALRNQIHKMPADNLGVILFLKTLEDTFNSCQIDADLRPAILAANLNEKARNAHLNMSIEEKNDFHLFKAALLKLFRVTPKSCRLDFNNATRQSNESYLQFANRLRIMLCSYLESRDIRTLADLVDLMLSDKIKDTLSFSQRRNVVDHEQDAWLTIENIGKLMDNFEMNNDHPAEAGNLMTSVTKPSNSGSWGSTSSTPRQGFGGERARRWVNYPPCSNCGLNNHDVSQCFRAPAAGQAPPSLPSGVATAKPSYPSIKKLNTGQKNHEYPRRPARTNVVTVQEKDVSLHEDDTLEDSQFDHEDDDEESHSINTITMVHENHSEITQNEDQSHPHKKVDNQNNIPVLRNDPGHFVLLNTGHKTVNALVDTGAQVSILRPDMVAPGHSAKNTAPIQISLRGPFGEKTKGILTNIQAKIMNDVDNENVHPISLSCVIAEKLNTDFMLLSWSDYNTLQENNRTATARHISKNISKKDRRVSQVKSKPELGLNLATQGKLDCKTFKRHNPHIARHFTHAKQLDKISFKDNTHTFSDIRQFKGDLTDQQTTKPESKCQSVKLKGQLISWFLIFLTLCLILIAHSSVGHTHFDLDSSCAKIDRIQNFFGCKGKQDDMINFKPLRPAGHIRVRSLPVRRHSIKTIGRIDELGKGKDRPYSSPTKYDLVQRVDIDQLDLSYRMWDPATSYLDPHTSHHNIFYMNPEHSSTFKHSIITIKGCAIKRSKPHCLPDISKYKVHSQGVNFHTQCYNFIMFIFDQVKTASRPEPTKKRPLRGFLSTAQINKNYVKIYSEIAFYSTEFTRDKISKQINFNNEQKKALVDFKNAFSNYTLLFTVRYDRKFFLRTDSSAYKIGGCLKQLDDEGIEHPIAFVSVKLLELQRKISLIGVGGLGSTVLPSEVKHLYIISDCLSRL